METGQGAQQEPGEEPVELPPPPPLTPQLDVPAPRVLAVRPDSARVEWLQATMAIPATDDARQLEVQQRFSYSVQHLLQMQEVAGGAGTSEEAAHKVLEKDWMVIVEAPCCNAEVRAGAPAADARAPISARALRCAFEEQRGPPTFRAFWPPAEG
jgi:hypothetical protein